MGKPTFGQIEEFYRLIASGKVNDRNFQTFLCNPDAYLAAKTGVVDPQLRILTVTITIDLARRYEEARDAGKYNYINPDINPNNFPMSVMCMGNGMITARLGIFTLGCGATDAEVVAHREQLGLQAVGMEHEFALGEQFPDLQCELGWIANRDVVWTIRDGFRRFSCLIGYAGERYLFTKEFDDSWWAGHWWFLGLYK